MCVSLRAHDISSLPPGPFSIFVLSPPSLLLLTSHVFSPYPADLGACVRACVSGYVCRFCSVEHGGGVKVPQQCGNESTVLSVSLSVSFPLSPPSPLPVGFSFSVPLMLSFYLSLCLAPSLFPSVGLSFSVFLSLSLSLCPLHCPPSLLTWSQSGQCTVSEWSDQNQTPREDLISKREAFYACPQEGDDS